MKTDSFIYLFNCGPAYFIYGTTFRTSRSGKQRAAGFVALQAAALHRGGSEVMSAGLKQEP